MRAALASALACAAPILCGASARAADAGPRKACVDAYLAAQSLRSEHRPLAARAQLRACARQECAALMHGQMLKDCAAWLAEVEPSVPTVVLSAKDAAGKELQDVRVSIDGAVVAERLDGRAVEMEPGSHAVVFTDASGATVAQTAVVLEGAKDQSIQAVFGGGAAAPEPAARANGGDAVAPAQAMPYWTGRRVFGAATAGAGVLAAGAAGVLALVAKSRFTAAEGESGQGRVDDSQGAVDLGNAASVVAGVGGGLVALGLVVWLTAPGGVAQAGTDGRRILVSGSF